MNPNQLRTRKARNILLAHYNLDTEGARTALIDLLADVYHFCDAHKLNFEGIQKSAHEHYCAERKSSQDATP